MKTKPFESVTVTLFRFLLILIPSFVFAEGMYSSTWGFSLDLPEYYEYTEGDGKDRFSFRGPEGAIFDLIVYNGIYSGIKEMAEDANKKLGNRGEIDYFKYHDKQAAIIELNFGGDKSGWGICVELTGVQKHRPPFLLALAYGPAAKTDLVLFHFSALDSITPSKAEKLYPGPITEYSYPRGERIMVPVATSGVTAAICKNDAEAAQVLIEREFVILTTYIDTPAWKQAWLRYYRFIYRDSYTRVENIASALIKKWGRGADRAFAQKALTFVQGFKYERNQKGSDFLNLVSAVTGGSGDCDSRAMLWALILNHADIRAAMMVSPKHSHAMGLADIAGAGARFEAYETNWLVAETTDNIDIGLIGKEQADPQNWFGILFE
ncbi:MAG: hypothetical protein LBB89_13425 [Treponema sp.]|jgi:hypothetical protein|nr:hypothetical protein [Treponema sp.]